jgi:hypothetical protein
MASRDKILQFLLNVQPFVQEEMPLPSGDTEYEEEGQELKKKTNPRSQIN